MKTLTLECLRCGIPRLLDRRRGRVDPGECPRCGYLGWAPSSSLSETARRRIRERPPEARVRLRAL